MSEHLEVTWSISVALLVVTSMLIGGIVALAAPVTAQSGSAPQVTDTGADQPRTTQEDTGLDITGISVTDVDNDGTPDVDMEAEFDVNGGTVNLANTNASVTSGTDGSDAVTIQGSVAEINDALGGMTFTPEADQNSQVTGYDPDIDITFTDTTNDDNTSYTVDNLAVSAVNDAPKVNQSNATGLNVSEGGSASFAAPNSSGQGFTQGELGLTEIDNNAEQTIIKITSLPGQGSLTFNGNPITTGSTLAAENLESLAYVHDGSQVTSSSTDTFNLTYDDGAGGLERDEPVTVNLKPVNQPPSVGGSVTVIENETDVRLDNNGNLPTLGDPRGAINITDPEGDSITEYTIDSLPTNGTLYYNGSSVNAGDNVTDITQLTYSHNGSEPAPESFNISVTDNGSGADNPKTASGTITLDIHPNNDDPMLTTNEEQTLGSGNSSLTLTNAMLGLTDPDTPDDALTYNVTDVPDPDDGYFAVNDERLQPGATFTQADINSGNVEYVTRSSAPDNATRADNFSFTVQDGGFRILPDEREGGIYHTDAQNSPLTENNFTVTVTDSVTEGPAAPSDAPTNTPPSTGGSNTAALLEGETVTLTSSMLNASDSEQSPGEIVYRLESLPASGDIRLNGERLRVGQSFTQADVNDGNVNFTHGGGEDFVDSFDYTVSDGQATSDAQTFDFDVTPQNDQPSAETDTAFVNEEETATLESANIALSDPDNSASDNETGFAADQDLNFTIDSLPGNGTLALDGAAVTAGDNVTQAQLNNGKLEYTHDGTENFTDNFAITPVDDAGVGSGDTTATNASSTGAQANVPIVIFPINDPPEPDFVSKSQLTTDEAGPVLEGDAVTIGGATSYDTINGVPGTGEPMPASGAHLSFGDNDSSNIQRQYRITTAPAHGQLLLNGKPVGVGSSFTQANLDNGNIQYEHDGTEGADYGNADSFDYIVSDGDWQANDTQTFAQGTSATPSTYNIDIAQRNDVPELDAPDSLDAFAPGTNTTEISGITVDDLDLDDGIQSNETDFMRVELSVLNNSDSLVDSGQLNYTATDPSGGNASVSGKGTESLIVQGNKTEIDAVLGSLTVAFSADADADDYKIRITADDRLYDSSGSLTSGTNGGPAPDNADGTPINATNNRVTQNITLRASNDNDVPNITNAKTYSVNEDSQVTLNGFTLTDADSFGEDVTATVELYNDSERTNLASAANQGSLRLGDTTGLTSSSGDDSNNITLTGSMSDVEDALNSLQFEGAPDYNGPVNGIGELYLQTTFEDFKHADSQETDSVNNTIEITPVNDQPTLTVPGDQTLDSGNSIAISGFNVSDTDDTDQGADDFISVEIAATRGGTSDGTINLTSSGGATVTDNGTATVTVNGTAANVRATLDSMDYAPDDLNVDETILMNVTADDRDPATGNGTGTEGVGVDGNNTVTDTFNIDVSDANEGPSVNGLSNQSVDEDASLTFSSGNAFNVSDPDDFGADMEAIVSVDHGTVTASGSGASLEGDDTASLTITGSETEINAALDGLVYTPDDDFHTNGTADPDTITVTIDDQGNTGSGGALNASQSATIDVDPVNDRPVASGDPENVNATGENQTGTPETLLSLLDDNYDDTTDNQTADGGGNTSTEFSYVAITGLTDYSTAQGTWQVNDSDGWIDVQTSGLDADGALVVNASREIRFDPAADFHGTPGTLDVRLADNSTDLSSEVSTGAGDRKDLSNVGGTGETGSWSADSVSIQTNVTNENDPPSATDDATLPAADEDATDPGGETVANLFDGVFNDSTDDQTGIGGNDASTSLGGIAIVGNAANASTEGEWQYSTDSGGNWNDISQGAADNTSAIILPDDAELRFVPVSDYNGAPGDLNVRLADADQTPDAGADISGAVGDDPTRDSDIWSNVTNLDTSVSPVDDGVADNFTTDEDTALSDDVSSNDTHSAPASYALNANATNGSVSMSPNGTFTYTPNADYNGPDSFTYDVTDVNGDTETVTVNLTVDPVVDIVDDTQTTDEDTSDTVDVLANDTFGGTPTVTGVTQGTNGTVVNNNDGTVTYTPDADFNGPDSYTYTVTSGGVTETATVDVAVNPVADGVADSFTTNEDTQLNDDVSTNDTHDAAASYALNTDASNGTVSMNSDGTFTYTPNTDYNGADSFTYDVTDVNGDTETVTASITVNSVDDMPAAAADSFTTDEDTAVSGDVSTNDTGLGDTPVSYALDSDPSSGTVNMNGDGTFDYTPDADFNGPDNFTYTVTDDDGDSATATVSITVDPVDDTPAPADDSFTTDEDATLSDDVSGNDTGLGDAPVTYSVAAGDEPAHGTVNMNGDGTFEYTPNASYNGSDSFTYTVTDDDGDSATATANITVDPVDDGSDGSDGDDGSDGSSEAAPDDGDADGDGVPDSEEGDGDLDGDGTPNDEDTDTDGDGIPDSEEGTTDTDGDGTPDYKDPDSDGDGIPDSEEGTTDTDGDGTPDHKDTDADGDGIPDSVEGTDDTDGDGTPNYLDPDSDGDGIPDSEEGTTDTDADGTPDYKDPDADGDGAPDAGEGTGDADGDGIADYLDPDTDGSDTIAPDITNFSVENVEGQNVTVSFDSSEELTDITILVSGPENATLTGDDFVYDSKNGTYTATYKGSSDGTYTATLATAADDAGNNGAASQQDNGDVGSGGSEAGTTDPGEKDGREDCELFGISYGSFIICWYWWLLIPIVGLSLVVSQIWHRGMLGQLIGIKNDDTGGEKNE